MKDDVFQKELARRILILDGAMGTMLQQAKLTAADFDGEEYEGCNEILNLTRPDLIHSIHKKYLEAGSDIVETNTFGATNVVLADYNLAERDVEINRAAARLAREAVQDFYTQDHPRFVAGAMGPTNKTLSLTGGVTFDELVVAYFRQAKGLIEGGVDILLLETSQDTLNVKAAGIGIQKAFEETGKKLPIMISGTIEPSGTTLAGQNIEAFYISLEHLKPVTIGINCATGPDLMRDHLRSLADIAHCGVSCYPNAGLPDEEGHYHEKPAEWAQKMADYAREGWLNVVGGCCGTTPEHIRVLAQVLQTYKPRALSKNHPSAVSGIEVVYVEEENRPLLVGERTNVIGSRKFRDLIANGSYEEAAEIARAQSKKGAQVIDICLANPDRDEYTDMADFLPYVSKKVKAPLMLDSTDVKVLELGLKHSQGKAIINSINLEEGLKRFEEVVPLVQKYGAAVVVGTIDETGMALTRERKLEIVKRSYELLANAGVGAEDIIFDPLTFPVGTGDKEYLGSARETVEGIRLIKKEIPGCKTILGVSNVSFGLPPAGREVLNAVFLYHATLAGLDYAIVNAEKLVRYPSIPKEERELAEALLFQTNDENLNRFSEFYRTKSLQGQDNKVSQNPNAKSLEERLSGYVVEGLKDGLLSDLEEALKKYTPLQIINGPLMEGMSEVGRLFNKNQLIVAEVLQSAEVMKSAVAYLENFLAKDEIALKGKVILATVKGDVHDIGKNLLEIIFSNNGYQVINLGIKVAPEQIIEACRKETPDAIGLSGLLVKSAHQMAITAQDLRAANISIPLLVGGAALTRKFTEERIAAEYGGPVFYASDAMKGLEIMNGLINGLMNGQTIKKPDSLKNDVKDNPTVSISENRGSYPGTPQYKPGTVSTNIPVSIPADLERHVLKNYPLSEIVPYLNRKMLLGKHLGVQGDVEKLLAEGDVKATNTYKIVQEVLEKVEKNALIQAHGIYRFFPAQSEGNTLRILNPENSNEVIGEFSFPRQISQPFLCLSDFVRPAESKEMDYIGFFALTTGLGVREQAEKLRNTGEFLYSHTLQALALELAEAFAEHLHHLMRNAWGIPDPEGMTMQERFRAHYRGLRVSFGYPACPNLEDQVRLFRLLQPQELGIELTEGFMMDPEASVSALVFAHPEARYFDARC